MREAKRPAAGFTLLELLVVMALAAMVVGLAAPSALRALDAARERGLVSDIEAQLAGLPAEAFASGQLLTLDAAALRRRLPDLPADWVLNLPEPLRYGSNGVARGGDVQLLPPGRAAIRWTVASFDGAVSRKREP